MKKMTAPEAPEKKIGSLNEKPLHAGLKEWYQAASDQAEVPLQGYVVDILRGNEIIEIQTGNFSAIKRKLQKLSKTNPVRLVFPIPFEKWILKLPVNRADGVSRRKSPKRGDIFNLFDELVRIPEMMGQDNFMLEVVFTREEELRRFDRRRAWRRKGWVIEERRLLEIVDRRIFSTPADVSALLPLTLPDSFTTADLAREIARPKRVAQKMTYCLKKMGQIQEVGKKGRHILYER
jgi:hypothetical protein